MPTAKDMMKRSLRLIQAIGNGEGIEPQEQDDALAALNSMLEAWALDGLVVYHITDTALTWPSGQGSQTIGATGDFAQTRPIEIESAFQRLSSIDYPISVLDEEQWFALIAKSTTSTLITEIWYENSFPNATIHVYPVPSAGATLHIIAREALQNFSTVTTSLSMPPGYQRAIEFNLAVDLAPEYGRPLPESVRRTAQASLRALRTINTRMPTLWQETAALSSGGSRAWNINSDAWRR